MAVIVQYIVVRDGVQKMTFTTKKEADAYDKMLDIADNLYDFMETAELTENEKLLEDISFFMAQNKDNVISILRGTKLKKDSRGSAKKSVPDKLPEKTETSPQSDTPKATGTEKKSPAKKKKAGKN